MTCFAPNTSGPGPDLGGLVPLDGRSPVLCIYLVCRPLGSAYAKTPQGYYLIFFSLNMSCILVYLASSGSFWIIFHFYFKASIVFTRIKEACVRMV